MMTALPLFCVRSIKVTSRGNVQSFLIKQIYQSNSLLMLFQTAALIMSLSANANISREGFLKPMFRKLLHSLYL